MGKPNNKEDKTTKKRQENIKNGNQVGRGRRTSLGGRAHIETFKPQNTQDPQAQQQLLLLLHQLLPQPGAQPPQVRGQQPQHLQAQQQ